MFTVFTESLSGWQGKGDGFDHYQVRAKLAILNKDFKAAEDIYLEKVWKHVVSLVGKTV